MARSVDYDSEVEGDPTLRLISNLHQQIRTLTAATSELQSTVTRLRAARDIHRNNTKELTTQNKGLIAQNAELVARIAELEKLTTTIKEEEIYEDGGDVYDSDDEDAADGAKPSIARIKKSPTPRKPQIPPKPAAEPLLGTNKKYPDVPLFFGEQEQWDGWRLHLYSKLRQSAVLFTCESDKMDYIRDHCRGSTFDTLKARADPLSEDPYTSSKEMISDLDDHCGIYDKMAVCNAQLHSPDFAMKKLETFDRFHTRFSTTVAPLRYGDLHKISALRRLITPKLRYQVADGFTPVSYRQFVARLRQCDLNMRHTEQWSRASPSPSPSPAQSSHTFDGDLEEITKYEFSTTHEYPEYFKNEVLRRRRCLKCLKPGHYPTSNGAPCKDSAFLSYEDARELLDST